VLVGYEVIMIVRRWSRSHEFLFCLGEEDFKFIHFENYKSKCLVEVTCKLEMKTLLINDRAFRNIVALVEVYCGDMGNIGLGTLLIGISKAADGGQLVRC
jgi:hypothetical protein